MLRRVLSAVFLACLVGPLLVLQPLAVVGQAWSWWPGSSADGDEAPIDVVASCLDILTGDLRLGPGDSVLEIGFGPTARSLRLLSDAVGGEDDRDDLRGFVAGIDVSADAVAAASADLVSEIEHGQVALVCADVAKTPLPFTDPDEVTFKPDWQKHVEKFSRDTEDAVHVRQFDYVVSINVVHYFEDVTEVVENLRALLRPSGRIAVCVGTSHAAAPHLEPDTAVDDAGLRLRSPRLDADDLVEALEDAGYKRVSTKTRGDVLCAVGSR